MRRAGCSLSISKNPVNLPMMHLGCRRYGRRSSWKNGVDRGGVCTRRSFVARNSQDALVLVWKDLDEARLRLGPVLQNPCGVRASGQVAMAFEQAAHPDYILRENQWFQIDAGLIAATRSEVAPLVIDVCVASAHAGGKVASGLSDYHHRAVGHVLAAVVAHALDHRNRAGVAHGEALAGNAVDEDFAAGSAVEHHVAHQDALLGQEAGLLGRVYDDAPAGDPLAQLEIGRALP